MGRRWRIELFGGLEVRRGERRIHHFPTKKTASLLAFLACHTEKPVHREILAETFWPEHDPESSRNSLRVALNALRRLFYEPDGAGDALLRADRSTISLDTAAFDTDIGDFEGALRDERCAGDTTERVAALSRAVDAYRGPLLIGWYEEWINLEQARLAEAYTGALRRLTSLLRDAGDFDTAIDYARRAALSDPLREEAHRLLMRLYAETGNVGAALKQYRELERLLASELGAMPSPVTRELMRNISSPPLPRPREDLALSARNIPSPLPVPLPLTTFYGREEEVGALTDLLHPTGAAPGPSRMVTITGIGGAGKSRLAAEVAARLQNNADDVAVWWVPLAGVTSPVEIPAAIAAALQITPHPDLTPFEQIVTALTHRKGVIVLDNFERLLDEGADAVRRFLQRVPGVTILVTTRQRLGVTGEREFPIVPLPTPRDLGGTGPVMVDDSPSAQLFIDRARAARPDFEVSPRNTRVIARICEQLDGLPLALELAAAWARLLSPAQILERLSARFDLLVSLDRNGDPRHRSMRAVLVESCRLMPEDLRAFFARLSVFRGGWTLTAAQAVCGEEDALEMIASLQLRSLVIVVAFGTEFRFRMLESVREFAAGLLLPEEVSRCHGEHCAFYANLAAEVGPHLGGVRNDSWLTRLDDEVDNLRGALRWGFQHGPSRRNAARLAGLLWRYWYARGRAEEGYRYIERALRPAPLGENTDGVVRGALLEGAGRFALSIGAATEACRWSKEAVDLLGDSTDRRRATTAATNLGVAARACGDAAAIQRVARLLVQWKEEEGDVWATSAALMDLGNAAMATGDGPLAYQSFTKALRVRAALGDGGGAAECRTALARLEPASASASLGRRPGDVRSGIAYSFLNLGHIACEQGDYDVAVPLLREALNVFRDDQDAPGVAITLERVGLAGYYGDDHETARAALEEVVALRQSGVGPLEAVAFPLRLLSELAAHCFVGAFESLP
jgi:predicted ATPase/DNA-binding SARP family transcriptional activator